MHCGFCLPTCPTYEDTRQEKHSPRGRIALMRSIADGRMEVTQGFANEMYFCLGCLACKTACRAGVDYRQLFETARATAENSGVLKTPKRDAIRSFLLKDLFTHPDWLRFVGRLLFLFQRSGLQSLSRRLNLTKFLPAGVARFEPQAPTIRSKCSHDLIRPVESPENGIVRYRVGMLTGCVQDLVFSDINRDTVDALLANGCEVYTPSTQSCCGSLHGHNGEPDLARMLARRNIDSFDLANLDAIIKNAAGCG